MSFDGRCPDAQRNCRKRSIGWVDNKGWNEEEYQPRSYRPESPRNQLHRKKLTILAMNDRVLADIEPRNSFDDMSR